MKVHVPIAAQGSPEAEQALDELLFALLVGAVERELAVAAAAAGDARQLVSSTGSDRDQAQRVEPERTNADDIESRQASQKNTLKERRRESTIDAA